MQRIDVKNTFPMNEYFYAGFKQGVFRQFGFYSMYVYSLYF